MRWLSCQIIIFFCVTQTVFAYTSPGHPDGFVNDFAGVLTDVEERQLEEHAARVQVHTGAEVAVVSVETLGTDTIEMYALDLFSEWGIGGVDKNNGILILFVPEAQEVRIEVGYGLEAVLVDAQAAAIIANQIVPSFKEGDYYGGVQAAMTQVERLVSGLPMETERRDISLGKALLLFFFGVIILMIQRSGWCKYVAILVSSWSGLWVYENMLFTGYALVTAGMAGIVMTVLCSIFQGRGGSGTTGGNSTRSPYYGRPAPRHGRGWGGFGGGRSGGGGASGRW